MGTTNTLDLNNRVGALKKAIAENAEDTHDIEEDIYAVMGKMGAKNLIPYPYKETTKTVNGITFTDNGDGTITANGTATSDAIIVLYQNSVSLLKVGRYILSGCPEGGGANIYKIQAAKNDWTFGGADFGVGAVFEITNESTQQIQYIRIVVSSGQTVSDLTFKPMFRLASDTDGTYQPYAKTNRELTGGLNAVKAQIPDAPSADGTYSLGVTVADGTSVYSWVSTS